MPKIARYSIFAAAFLAASLCIAGIFLARNWPFTKQAITRSLEQRFERQVEIGAFRPTYFPPGCVAEDVRFLHRKRKDLPPLITVKRLTIRGSYTGMIGFHKRIPDVQIAGLHVLIPPKNVRSSSKGIMPDTSSRGGKSVGYGRITTDGAVLEFRSDQPGKEPMKIEIRRLILDGAGEGGPISYRASLVNGKPPGEIVSTGKIGPWNGDDPGSTPISGDYRFDRARLGVFKGIAGTLSSGGKFNGTLHRIECEGGADVPDFTVTKGINVVHLTTKFHAAVDASNGDTFVHEAASHFRKTTIVSRGDITGQDGKTVALDVAIREGRVEDLLRLIAQQQRPSMTGQISLRAKVEIPPDDAAFLRKIKMQGDFGVGGTFTNPKAQVPINKLSESAAGESKKEQAEDPATVLSNLKGHVVVKNGVATILHGSCNVPGAFAEMRGTYNLIDKTVNMKGVLHTTGKLSDTTSGVKSLFLKVATPFLKRKSVTVAPFTIKGTSSHPLFAIDFDGKRHL